MNFSLGLVQEIILIIINAVAVLIGSLVFKSNPRDGQNRWFLLMSVLIIFWVNFAFFGSVTVGDSVLSVLFYRLNWFVVSLSLFVFYYFFVAYFLKQINKHKILDAIILICSLVLAYLSIGTDLIISGVLERNWGMEIVFGLMASILNIFAVTVSLVVTYFGYKQYISSKKKEQRRVVYFFIGILIFIIANVIFNVIIPSLLNTAEYQHFGDFSVIFFLGFAAYAMVKHHLFDVRLAVVRSIVYSLVLATLAGIYLFIALVFSAVFNKEIVSPGQTISAVIISLILAFAFQPIKRFFDKITNKFFYKDNYNIDDFFTYLNRTLTSTTELRVLLERVAVEIGQTLKSEQAFFFVNIPGGHYVSAGTLGHKYLPKDDANELESVTVLKHGVIVRSLLGADDSVRRMMLSHRVELILPLKQTDDYIGYLCLGDSLASGYTRRDIRVLRTLSDELVIAIENALSVQEIRNLNETLQQRINEATKELRASNAQLQRLDKAKDEFVSMASHQLRTPLTSVKGYISMVLEGDAGKITDAQEHLLGEAFNSSERMVHLINDFLNVSRLQTGKFIIDKRPVDLAKVVEQELDSLATNASSRNLKFIYKSPKNFPILNLDEGKMRQVIMNFADNAIFYSGESTEIQVSLSVEAGNCIFTVKDTGIGVPSAEQSQLFSKFYRASNARKQRPDGTGVGLFLAKKVILAHGGEVIFESFEGKGSTFGFKLPLKELRATDDVNQLENKPNDN